MLLKFFKGVSLKFIFKFNEYFLKFDKKNLDKENDIDFKTNSLHKELESERKNQRKLHNDISQLQSQLQEAKNGLMAAARLSDQLELNQLTIDKLNNESKFLF